MRTFLTICDEAGTDIEVTAFYSYSLEYCIGDEAHTMDCVDIKALDFNDFGSIESVVTGRCESDCKTCKSCDREVITDPEMIIQVGRELKVQILNSL